MHIAAFSPSVLTRDEVDAETVENERRVAEATAKEEGKPEAALSRIVEGRVNGYFKENVLLEQPFAKEPKKTVGQGPPGGRRRRQGLRALPRRELTSRRTTQHPGCRPLTTSGRHPAVGVGGVRSWSRGRSPAVGRSTGR